MSSVWVLTAKVNAYDQYGEYFITAFTQKPTLEDIRKTLNLIPNSPLAVHVLNGGGLVKNEPVWYYLKEYMSGEICYFDG
jgi:hypothetical protein